MRWGDNLEFVAEAGPGDFIFVPPFVPHQEINASTDEPLDCVLVRSDNENVVVNLDIEPAERPEHVKWVDPIHRGATCPAARLPVVQCTCSSERDRHFSAGPAPLRAWIGVAVNAGRKPCFGHAP